MKLIIDGQAVGEVDGVSAAIEMARARAAELGRLIIEVQADGSPAGELLDAPESGSGVGELGVVTADKSLFLRETLRDARDALESTRADQRRGAALIDKGEVGEAIGALRSIVEGWQAVRTVVDQAAALGDVQLDTLTAGELSGVELFNALTADLIALRNAVGGEDWSALSDVLAFDLDERAAQWGVLIETLITRVGEPK